MKNPIAQTLSSTQSQNLANNIFSFLKMTQDPSTMLQKLMASRDPRLTQLMNMINQSGGDPEKLARKILAERGIDADQLISQLRSAKS